MTISIKVLLHTLYRNFKTFIKNVFSYLIIQTLNAQTDREFDNHDEHHLKLRKRIGIFNSKFIKIFW